ncbi:MAG TPA: hypothetical protein VGC92_10910 [Phenylobacterium sp.]|jgi:hypothetical protein
MLTLSCICGGVRIEVAKRPDFIHACNCTLCNKAGARWGYFHPSEVSVAGDARGYRRDDKDDPNAEVRFCPTCGATTHFVLTESAVSRFGDSVVGVNMWLANARDLAGIELRYPDGAAWPGEGPFSYVREARILGPAATSE